MPPKKVLLVANTAWYLYNFRLPLAKALRKQGYSPAFVGPADPYAEKLRAEGFEFHELEMQRAGINPFTELATLSRLAAIYRREKPVLAHHMTIKCVLYGSIAARLAGVPAVLNAVTGLGHVFVSASARAAVLRPLVKTLYRFALSAGRARVVFQNSDDLKAFAELGLTDGARTALIRGSGVNTERFSPRAPKNGGEPIVLLVGRLLAEKGIFEFVEAAAALRARGVAARFVVAGAPDAGNPSSVAAEQLERWRAEGVVDFRGHVDGIENLVAEATLVVLPSYREGVPRTLLEAAAMEKPLVATDVPGCREVVEHGVNGLLVPARDSKALAGAIEKLLSEPETRARMGRAGREKAVREFDERAVLLATIAIYDELVK